MTQSTTLGLTRVFTSENVHPYDMMPWLPAAGGGFPDFWSPQAVDFVRHHYLPPALQGGEPYTLKDVLDRVADAITRYGFEEDYFSSHQEADIFNQELKYILATQRATFDGPVWESTGAVGQPQQAAGMVLLGTDGTDAAAGASLQQNAAMVLERGQNFAVNIGGFGAGEAITQLRAMQAMATMLLSAGAMEPVGVIEIDHPDVAALLATGEPLVVRVSDNFMRAVSDGREWPTVKTAGGESRLAAALLQDVLAAATRTGQPALQFTTAVSDWWISFNQNPVRAVSPDGGFMGPDNAACVAGQLNLLRFVDAAGTFDADGYRQTVRIMTIALEILIGYAHYATEDIDRLTRALRPLGLSFGNLGSVLLAKGLGYDTPEARAYAATLTSLMTAEAYSTSAKMAAMTGPFTGTSAAGSENLQRILQKHRAALGKIDPLVAPPELSVAVGVWAEAVDLASQHGLRNAQVTLLTDKPPMNLLVDMVSPTILPLARLVSGEATESQVSVAVPMALRALGYDRQTAEGIVTYIATTHTHEGPPGLRPQDAAVFATVMGGGAISLEAQLQMAAAVQPHISGGIGSSFLVASPLSEEEMVEACLLAWKKGLKYMALQTTDYAGEAGSAATSQTSMAPGELALPQPENLTAIAEALAKPAIADEPAAAPEPLPIEPSVRPSTSEPSTPKVQSESSAAAAPPQVRVLPPRRRARTYEFHVDDCKGFMTVGEFEDGQPGELFLRIAKQGSTLGGVMDALAISVSHGLQHGVSLKDYVRAFQGHTFMPSGPTDDPDIPTATSLTDYIFRRLARDYLSFAEQLELGLVSPEDEAAIQQQRLLD